MKGKRILRLLGITLILSLLLAAIPSGPALAYSYEIDIDPDTGAIGEEITITGEDFVPSSDAVEKWVRIFFSDEEAYVNDEIDDDVLNYEIVGSSQIGFADEADEGEFTATFDVPAELTDGDDDVDVSSGTYYVYCTITMTDPPGVKIYSKAEFTVIGGEIELDIDSGPVDSYVEITGTGFSGNEDIDKIEFGGDEVDIDGDDDTDSDGDFVSYIIVPESPAGDSTITVTVGNTEAEADFTVEPDILVTPQSGEAGASITISGTGFARRPKEVFVYFNNNLTATASMDSNGSFDATFPVPDGLAAGIYSLEAEDENLNRATASFTVNVAESPEPTEPPEPTDTPEPTTPVPSQTDLTIISSGNTVGAVIGIGGAGFTASSAVTITYDTTTIATSTTDANGAFTAQFGAPQSKAGSHTITATDGVNIGTATFTIESVPPEIPPPLLPEMGVKVKSPISFDWEDVTDESLPVTYQLQVAIDEEFTSPVLDITGIKTSEYTLTEMEELELAGQEDPYYWRIRALDGASNPSGWTGAGEMYVSGPGSFPKWALYTLLGVGAVIIFGIGYWLGRRTAFYY